MILGKKIAAVPTHVPLEAQYLVVGGLIVPAKENAVCTPEFWICFVISSTPEVVKTHLSSGHEPQGAIYTLEVCFYHKPSLKSMRFNKM